MVSTDYHENNLKMPFPVLDLVLPFRKTFNKQICDVVVIVVDGFKVGSVGT